MRDKIGLYSSYFFCMSGLGFILPFFPLYLSERGFSDQALGIIWTLAALSSLLLLPLGVLSDRTGWRRPMLLVSLVLIAVTGVAIIFTSNYWLLIFLVFLFSENGIMRGLVENLSGAEASSLARSGKEGTALSLLRVWRPAGTIIVALICSATVTYIGLSGLFNLIVVLQIMAVIAILLVRYQKCEFESGSKKLTSSFSSTIRKDWMLNTFVLAMILFHLAGAPLGLYFGLFASRELQLSESFIAVSFVVNMLVWLIVIPPTGHIIDRYGCKLLMIFGWSMLVVRNIIIFIAEEAWQLVVLQIIDGLSNGMFAVISASWVVKRIGGKNRSGEAHAIVGTCLVFGSAMGTLISGLLIESIGYRVLFGGLSIVALIATSLIIFGISDVRIVRQKRYT